MSKALIFFIFSIFASIQVFSQPINGIVINSEDKKPIADANVVVRNSTVGTVTDNNGLFNLELQNIENTLIQVSCIGYKTQEIDYKS